MTQRFSLAPCWYTVGLYQVSLARFFRRPQTPDHGPSNRLVNVGQFVGETITRTLMSALRNTKPQGNARIIIGEQIQVPTFPADHLQFGRGEA